MDDQGVGNGYRMATSESRRHGSRRLHGRDHLPEERAGRHVKWVDDGTGFHD